MVNEVWKKKKKKKKKMSDVQMYTGQVVTGVHRLQTLYSTLHITSMLKLLYFKFLPYVGLYE